MVCGPSATAAWTPWRIACASWKTAERDRLRARRAALYGKIRNMGESKAAQVAVADSRAGLAAGGAREAAWKEHVGRCVLEDAAALGNLYDESSSLVYSLALRVVGNGADAEEVTLDV